MGPHIIPKWGWDEDYQLSVQQKRWDEKPWFIILMDDKPIGTVSIHHFESHVRFGEFYCIANFKTRVSEQKFCKNF